VSLGVLGWGVGVIVAEGLGVGLTVAEGLGVGLGVIFTDGLVLGVGCELMIGVTGSELAGDNCVLMMVKAAKLAA
jgi:hypothetical protein